MELHYQRLVKRFRDLTYVHEPAVGSIRVRPSIIKATFLAAIVLSMGGWIWLLGVAIRWLIVKL